VGQVAMNQVRPPLLQRRQHAASPREASAPVGGGIGFGPLLLVRRNEDDGCQLVEAAVTGHALSIRSCMGQPTSARCPREQPISYTMGRRTRSNFSSPEGRNQSTGWRLK